MVKLLTLLFIATVGQTAVHGAAISGMPLQRISYGHCLGCTENIFLQNIFARANNGFGTFVARELENSVDSYSIADNRFLDGPPMADLICVYSGNTSQVNEIYELIKSGLIIPIEQLPEFETKLKLEEFYPNVLEPASLFSKLWAIPIRMGTTSISIRNSACLDTTTWEELAACGRSNGFTFSHPSDPFMLWRTIAAALGNDFLSLDDNSLYSLDVNASQSAFDMLHSMWRGLDGGKEGAIEILVPDKFMTNGTELSDVKFSVYPVPDAPVFVAENTWYLAVSAKIAPEKLPAVVEILAELTGRSVQMRVSQLAFSPPVRLSIANSDEFRDTFADGSAQRVFSDMVPRISFRKGGPGREEAEKVLEAAFNRCIEEPENFLPLMSEAVNEANALVAGARR